MYIKLLKDQLFLCELACLREGFHLVVSDGRMLASLSSKCGIVGSNPTQAGNLFTDLILMSRVEFKTNCLLLPHC